MSRLRTSPAIVFYAVGDYVAAFIHGQISPRDLRKLGAARARLLPRADRRRLKLTPEACVSGGARLPVGLARAIAAPSIESKVARSHRERGEKRRAKAKARERRRPT